MIKLPKQIAETMREISRCKPRSARYAVLHGRLKMLRLKQLRLEIRINKKAA